MILSIASNCGKTQARLCWLARRYRQKRLRHGMMLSVGLIV
ncbi:hypothetical protein V4210_01615 [Candidatus Nanosynbacter sp. BB002]